VALSPEALLERQAYIGGTDAAALAGVNPPGWAQPIDVYLEKRGEAPERRGSSAMSMGHLLEPVVAALFTEATGLRLRRPAKPVRSRLYPWAGGHLDRWAEDGLPFEAKWAMRSADWGPGLGWGTPEAPVVIPAPDDDEYQPVVPVHYAVQVQHYLAVTARPTAYLAALLGYGDFRWYAIHRDEALIGTLMQLEQRFWEDNVLAGVPPEPDGSESYSRHLRRLHATSTDDEVVATPEQQAILEALRAGRTEVAAGAALVAKLEQRLQLSMGAHGRLVAPGAHVSYQHTKPRLVVEWEGLVEALLREQAELAVAQGAPVAWPATKKAVAEYVRTVARAYGKAHDEEGTRPFRVMFDSDEKAD
jgi:predicted phage-related endonuclease